MLGALLRRSGIGLPSMGDITGDPESWRMGPLELRDLLGRYEKAVEEDAFNLLRPRPAEREMLGKDRIEKRCDAVRKARDFNRRSVEAVIADLPDLCGPEGAPSRPVADFRCPGPGGVAIDLLPASSYGSLASVFLHLLRDWSPISDNVLTSTYSPAIAELQALLPPGKEVLVPGAGLGRLALELAGQGYKVEANEGSKLFLTYADFLLNRPPATAVPIFPLAHVFSENFGHAQQYVEVNVPSIKSDDILAGVRGANGSAGPAFTMVPGDFAKTYGVGCPGHRRFDAVVTCFFIDTPIDVVELFTVLDSLLGEGGVWINVGPLNWRKESRLKLCWEEIVEIWQGMGYEFVSQKSVDVDYHFPRGQKMYTESYKCALTAAIKRRAPEA